jgi:cellulose synthase/poly-beta-1,6-N-acetylglucosamine synthase-like glycosyltransferase
VINKALPQLIAEIIVFSDANTEYDPGAIQRMVVRFADPRIGCVCGRLIYRNPIQVISGKGESFYWRYETALKKMESRIGYIAGANGAIYAIRRACSNLCRQTRSMMISPYP